jgi:hypothetical protein
MSTSPTGPNSNNVPPLRIGQAPEVAAHVLASGEAA